MALTWASPDRLVLSVVFVSDRKWRFVGNTAQLARVDDLPHVLDWFLRRADDLINRLAARLHATGRTTTRSPGRGSLRCHARLPMGTLMYPADRTLEQNRLPRNLAGTRQLIRPQPSRQSVTLPCHGVDIIVPSLPGFAFSDHIAQPLGPRAAADLINELLTDVLGHERYLLHGGDYGAIIADWAAMHHPDHVAGLHLHLAFTRHDGAPFGSGNTGPGPSTQEERDWAAAEKASVEPRFAYFQLHTSDPLTISYALMDNPVGLAAWITDKFLHWADSTNTTPENIFEMDTLLTDIMIYLVTDTFYTSVTHYRAMSQEGPITLPPGERIEVPTSFAAFPDPCPPPPRGFFDRSHNIVRWTGMPRGGHFPALEEPQLLVDDLRRFVATIMN